MQHTASLLKGCSLALVHVLYDSSRHLVFRPLHAFECEIKDEDTSSQSIGVATMASVTIQRKNKRAATTSRKKTPTMTIDAIIANLKDKEILYGEKVVVSAKDLHAIVAPHVNGTSLTPRQLLIKLGIPYDECWPVKKTSEGLKECDRKYTRGDLVALPSLLTTYLRQFVGTWFIGSTSASTSAEQEDAASPEVPSAPTQTADTSTDTKVRAAAPLGSLQCLLSGSKV
jgi:hypothetical protein